jgi:hypothetical protein
MNCKLLLLLLLLGLCFSCSNQQPVPLHCSWCNGKIFYHKISFGLLGNQYQIMYQNEENKNYHHWCYKLKQK